MSARQAGACSTRQPSGSLQARLRRSSRPATRISAAESPQQVDARPYAAPRAVVELTGRQRRTVQLDGAGAGTSLAPPAASSSSSNILEGPLASLRDFFLPKGWPATVSPDYLRWVGWGSNRGWAGVDRLPARVCSAGAVPCTHAPFVSLPQHACPACVLRPPPPVPVATPTLCCCRYQLATVPAHISGWMSHSLATSSMIQVWQGTRR